MSMQQANEKISEWHGRPCTCEHGFEPDPIGGIVQTTTYWGNCAMHSCGGSPTPYLTSDPRAVELLETLVEKNYPHKLEFTSNWQRYTFEVSVWHNKVGFKTYAASRQRLADAICSAILLMMRKEQRHETNREALHGNQAR